MPDAKTIAPCGSVSHAIDIPFKTNLHSQEDFRWARSSKHRRLQDGLSVCLQTGIGHSQSVRCQSVCCRKQIGRSPYCGVQICIDLLDTFYRIPTFLLRACALCPSRELVTDYVIHSYCVPSIIGPSPFPHTVIMPATRSRATPVRSQSVPLPLSRAIHQPPLYQSSTPITLPLPIIRTSLVYSGGGELPLILLHRPLPRLHHRLQARRVSINPNDVKLDRRTPVSRETPLPHERSPLTDISDESDAASEGSDVEIIPKPRGEAGRPDSGGYNLEIAMNWNPSEFTRLRVTLYSQCPIPLLSRCRIAPTS